MNIQFYSKRSTFFLRFTVEVLDILLLFLQIHSLLETISYCVLLKTVDDAEAGSVRAGML